MEARTAAKETDFTPSDVPTLEDALEDAEESTYHPSADEEEEDRQHDTYAEVDPGIEPVLHHSTAEEVIDI